MPKAPPFAKEFSRREEPASLAEASEAHQKGKLFTSKERVRIFV